MSIVVDASTALASVLPDESSAYARAAIAAALDEGLVVPTLWAYELQNGLLMAVRRHRIDATSADDALDALRSLRADLRAPHGLGQELRLGRVHGLTAYDAAYLAVALTTGARFATSDGRLRDAAERSGVAVFTAD
jgi:predicted nucleic acid-binding protein